MNFQVGNGQTLVRLGFREDGVSLVHVTRNQTDMTFVNGQTLTLEENIKFLTETEVIPDATFEFIDLELAIKFYSGFFREPDQTRIDWLRKQHSIWHLTICC